MKLKLPKGYKPNEMLEQVLLGNTPSRERGNDEVFEIEEELQLDMARIPPAQYRAFSPFAAEVDFMQARELTVVPVAQGH